MNEDAAPGTEVGVVNATDEDEDQNAKITYDLVDSYFRINQIQLKLPFLAILTEKVCLAIR